jgi:hypothetical protein
LSQIDIVPDIGLRWQVLVEDSTWRSPKAVRAAYKKEESGLRDTKIAFRNIARVDEQRNDQGAS